MLAQLHSVPLVAPVPPLIEGHVKQLPLARVNCFVELHETTVEFVHIPPTQL